MSLSAIVFLLIGCGGSSPSPAGTNTPTASTGEWCDLPYYRNIIGTYAGNIEYQVIDPRSGAEVQNCHWDTRLTISGNSILNKCFVEMQLNAIPTQLFVPESTSPTVHQCRGDNNRIYRLMDPNGSANEAMLTQVGFPLLMRQSGHDLDPTREPYFGDESVLAFQVYLLAGGGPIADQLLISDEGYLDLIDPTPETFFTTNFQSRLIKEVSQ